MEKHYDIVRPLGEGGFGVVYLVKRKTDGHRSAAKVFKSGMIDSVIVDKLIDTEIDLLKALCHPNIVAFHELFVEPGSRCMLMEYCSGGDLASRLHVARTSNQAFPLDLAHSVFCQVLLALHHCHHAYDGQWTLLHRDLKPENVLFDGSGTVKVADLGLAKVLERGRTSTKSLVGTPGYMPPELIAGRPYGHKADIYGLGCLFVEMYTLKLPDPRLRGVERARDLLLPGRFGSHDQELVNSLLAVDPDRRPSTADLLFFPPISQWFNEIRCDGRRHKSDDDDLVLKQAKSSTERKEQELGVRERALDSREKSLRDRQHVLEAKEATLEARLRRLNARVSLSPEPAVTSKAKSISSILQSPAGQRK